MIADIIEPKNLLAIERFERLRSKSNDDLQFMCNTNTNQEFKCVGWIIKCNSFISQYGKCNKNCSRLIHAFVASSFLIPTTVSGEELKVLCRIVNK